MNYLSLNTRMKGILFIFAQMLCVSSSVRNNCASTSEKTVTTAEGTISTSDVPQWQKFCNFSWVFPNLPREGRLLILNMTQKPSLYPDVVRLYGDVFIDDSSEFKYCKILESRQRWMGADMLMDVEQISNLSDLYPGCKIRSGVQSPVIVSYVPRGMSDFNPQQHFTIHYKEVDDPFSTQPSHPLPTSSSETMTTTMNVDFSTSANVTISGGIESVLSRETTTVIIVVATLGTVLMILLVIMVIAIVRRKRQKPDEISKTELQANNIYETTPEGNGNNNVEVYSEIQNGKNDGSDCSNGETDKEVVFNPLYGDHMQQNNKHSYEYIEVQPNGNGEERSAL